MLKSNDILATFRVRHFLIMIMAVSIVYINQPVNGQAVRTDDPALTGIDVIERSGDTIPLDIQLTDEAGRSVALGNYFSDNKPVVLIMAYYTCPMLCNLVLNGVAQTASKLDWLPGREYRIVTVSIDSTEDFKLAAEKKANYIRNMGRPNASPGWQFFTAEGVQSRRLADALGFQYYYDEKQKQYAHAAVVFVLTPEGGISRYLYGIDFPPRDLKLALMEAADGKIGDTIDRILLYCYHYDPSAGGYVVLASRVMTVGGAATLFVLVMFLGGFWLYEVRRRQNIGRVDCGETQVKR